MGKGKPGEQWHPDPTPEELEERKRQVREEGFHNDRGEFRKPWSKERKQTRFKPPPTETRVLSSSELHITDDERI